MLKVSEIIGSNVICMDTKRKEGEVKEVILDLNCGKITYFIIEGGNILHKTNIIDYKNICGIESDSITIKLKNNLKSMKDVKFNFKLFKKSKKILGMEVISQNGDIIGFIQDIFFEETDGSILGFIISNGIINDIFSGVQILPLNEKIAYKNNKVVVSDTNLILNNIGGLKKLLELEK